MALMSRRRRPRPDHRLSFVIPNPLLRCVTVREIDDTRAPDAPDAPPLLSAAPDASDGLRSEAETGEPGADDDARDSSRSPLALYLGDLQRQPQPEDGHEFPAVRAIRVLESALWKILLGGCPAASKAVAAAAEASLAEPMPKLQAVASALERRKGQRLLAALLPQLVAASTRREALTAALGAARARRGMRGHHRWLAKVEVIASRLAAAKSDFVVRNLRLAVSIAKGMVRPGMPLPDAIQEANMGIMRALDGFDPERGFRFTTYATHWIRQHIRRAADNHSRTIRIPVHMLDTIRQAHLAAMALRRTLDRDPSDEEIARYLLAQESGKAVVAGAVAAAIEGLAKTRRYWLLATDPVSLDAPLPGREETTLGQSLLDDRLLDTDDLIVDAERTAAALGALDGLPAREADILRMRFGMDGESRTLDEIGQILGCSRERVRQLQERALQALRTRLDPASRPCRPGQARSDAVSGRRFGKLVVTALARRESWMCRCDCGGGTVAYAKDLLSGKARDCGCLRGRPGSLRPPFVPGQRLGEITVVGAAELSLYGAWSRWRVRCGKCGDEAVVGIMRLRRGLPFGSCLGRAPRRRRRARV